VPDQLVVKEMAKDLVTELDSKSTSAIPGAGVTHGVCNIESVDLAEPVELFMELFNDEVVAEILSSTNRELERLDSKVEPFSLAEMYAYFGIIILSGIIRMPTWDMYWSNEFGLEQIRNALTRDRFFSLNAHVMIVPPSSEPAAPAPSASASSSAASASASADEKANAQRQATLRAAREREMRVRGTDGSALDGVFEELSKSFRTAVTPGRVVIVDETMILCRMTGEKLRTLMPSKPIPHGWKQWTAATRSGYVLGMRLYDPVREKTAGKGMTARVVTRLIEPWHATWRTVVFDKFFTTTRLMRDLYHLGWTAIGSMNPQRCHKQLALGRVDWKNGMIIRISKMLNPKVAYEPLAFCAWHIKDKTRHFAYTVGGRMCEIVQLRTADEQKHSEQRNGPAVAKQYYHWYGGVDRADQLLAEYQNDHRHSRRSSALLYHLVITSATNAFVIARDYGEWKLGHLKFATELATALLLMSPKKSDSPKSPVLPLTSKCKLRTSVVHLRRVCHLCYKHVPTECGNDVCVGQHGRGKGKHLPVCVNCFFEHATLQLGK
jgi:hypothetical protein